MSSSLLLALGWAAPFPRLFESLQRPDLKPARVSAEHRGQLEIFTEDGPARAHTRRALPEPPAVGDWVAVLPLADGSYVVEAVLDRRSAFARRAPGRAERRQVIAANIDTVLIASALNQELNPRRIERYLAPVRAGGAEPVVVLTKSDLCPDADARAAQVRHDRVHVVSARTGQGMASLWAYLAPGQTAALAGSSGVGKSTLVNALLGGEIQAVKEIREADAKGRHTTVARRLLPVPDGGAILDTPGMRELGLWAEDEGEALGEVFDDIAAFAQACAFRDCAHDGEPGCAVQAAIEEGSLDPARLESQRKLERELHWQENRQKEWARREEARQWGRRVKRMQADQRKIKGR